VAASVEYVAVDEPTQISNHTSIQCPCEQSHLGGQLDHFGAVHPGDIWKITPPECWCHLRVSTVVHKVSQHASASQWTLGLRGRGDCTCKEKIAVAVASRAVAKLIHNSARIGDST